MESNSKDPKAVMSTPGCLYEKETEGKFETVADDLLLRIYSLDQKKLYY